MMRGMIRRRLEVKAVMQTVGAIGRGHEAPGASNPIPPVVNTSKGSHEPAGRSMGGRRRHFPSLEGIALPIKY